MQYDLMFNGDRRFKIAFIETLDRRFPGEEQSSLLLACVVLASRWRFNYFERWSETTDTLFGDRAPLAHFSDACRQLLYNIEWIENEAAELGANDQRAMVHAFGHRHRARVDRFFDDYRRAKEELMGVLRLDMAITEQNRPELRNAVLRFLDATRQQNLEFLLLALQVYGDLLKGELRLAEAS
jgi:hypothetical protein